MLSYAPRRTWTAQRAHLLAGQGRPSRRTSRRRSTGIRKIADAHRGLSQGHPRAEAGKDIRIALDEWNFWYGGNEYGELGTRYFLQDGLGIAAALHEMFRNSDIFWMANYAQTVNVIGAIKTTQDGRGDGGDGLGARDLPASFRDAAA